MAAKLEIKHSSRISYGKNGYRVVRVALVSGVSGNADNLLFQAVNDSQLPRFGDPHPTVPGITLNNIVADPLGGGKYRILMTYFNDLGSGSAAGGVTSRASGSTAVEEVNTDVNGARMVTQYAVASGLRSKTFTAEVERPRTTFDFTYNASQFPKDTINTYLGKVNSARWNDYPKKTILCTAVHVDQRADEYQVRISLAYNEETWDFHGVVSGVSGTGLFPHPTNPDPLLDLDTGIRTFQVYEQVDFSPLSLVL